MKDRVEKFYNTINKIGRLVNIFLPFYSHIIAFFFLVDLELRSIY
jgi:hypothetical protein